MIKPVIIGLIGCLLIGLGIVALLTVPQIVQKNIQQRLTLKEGSQAYSIWEKVPLPIYNKFYFFNVTNSQAIEREGAKPILKQIGPFTYRVSIAKVSIVNNENGTLSYREKKSWHFERALSVADETQIITTLNTPLALTLTLIQGASSTVRVLVTLALDAVTEGFFIKRTVKQLLFQGYPDLLTTFGPLLNPEIPANNGRFGYMFPKNNTDDGLYTIYSGINDINLLNVIERYNGRSSLAYWTSEECNSLKGSTNGQMGPPQTESPEYDESDDDDNPDSSRPQNIRMFASEACRILNLKYNRTHQPYPDLSVHRYTFDQTNFASSTDYPSNECYISKLPDPAPSLLYSLTRGSSATSSPASPATSPTPSFRTRRQPFASGVFDLSACKYGAPFVISQPHFLNSHPSYQASIDGLTPNESSHSFWMDVEPLTGSTVNLAARLQLNVAINKAPGLFRYRNIPEIVFPIFWQEYHFEFSRDLAQKLIDLKAMPYLVSSISFYSSLSIGIVLIITSLLVYAIPFLRSHNLEINGKPIQANINTMTKPSKEDDREILNRKTSSNSTDDGIDNSANLSSC